MKDFIQIFKKSLRDLLKRVALNFTQLLQQPAVYLERR